MEAFAIIGTISSIVQLVDFCGKCTGKGLRLYRSSSGILDSNAAVELAVNHLTLLQRKVEAGATYAADSSLQQLCRAVAETSSDLLRALEKLKVKGKTTKWKSMRKALKSVWTKEEIEELEHRLANFREELNLHYTIDIRQRLETLEVDVKAFFSTCSDERTREIVDALVDQQDVFQSSLYDHQALIESTIAERGTKLQESFEDLRAELWRMVTEADQRNQEQHDITRRQIIEVMKALRLLLLEKEAKQREHEDVITAYVNSNSTKRKGTLQARSKALTSAILALEAIYRSLKAVLASLQVAMDNLSMSVQRSNIWKVSLYVRRTTAPSADNERAVELLPLTFCPRIILELFYSWVINHAELAEAEEMEKRWSFQREVSDTLTSSANYEGYLVEDSYCSSASMWLVAAITAALQMHMKPETAAFTLIPNTFSESHTLARENSYFAGPLRGQRKDFDPNGLLTDEKKDLEALLHWLIGSPKRKADHVNAGPRGSWGRGPSPARFKGWSQTTDVVHVGVDGAAMAITKSLIAMGLNIRLDWKSWDNNHIGNHIARIS
ncbi:hypothetical protein EV356DRAFT_531359 [Viridothelium virens]|uniref:Fungal N-terminal domain-containing protein n=1 Tax=Viridothelium virens TaxID=1048519 RepID=A0A6A6HDB8_VIRVR|nr:hypothetical protein EV356DRAFT_531359 [Viridothelium virens]